MSASEVPSDVGYSVMLSSPGGTTPLAYSPESAGAARICEQAGVPFTCLRAVSDDVHTPFPPELIRALQGERVHAGRLIRAVLRNPLLVCDLARLARHSRAAAAALADGLLRLIGTVGE